MSNTSSRKDSFYGFLVILLLTVFCYVPSLKNPLLWDDEVTVLGNLLIRDFRNLPTVFTSGYHAGGGDLTNLYRPLAVVSFMVDYAIWGLKPLGFHLTNLILHLLNVSLVYWILRRVLDSRFLIFIATALFAVHPINSEVVNYVSHRPELLMGLFLLASFHQYLVFRQEGSRFSFGLSLVLFIAALLSKEMGILLPFFLFLYEVGARRAVPLQTSKRQLRFVVPFLIVAILYLVLRATVLNFLNIPFWKGAQAEPFSDNLWIRLLTAAKVHWIYLRLLFWPVGLHMDHDVPIAVSWGEPVGLAAMAGILLFLAMGWFLRRRQPLLSFGIFWYFGGLAPVSNFLPLNTAIAEHYLYIPSIGFFIAVAALLIPVFCRGNPPWLPSRRGGGTPPLQWNSGRHRGLPLLGVFVVLCMMSLTFLRTLEWGDEEKLYLSTVNNTRASFRANNNLGVYYFRNNQMDKAEEYFKRSLEILPTYAEALNNIGAVYQRKGDLLGAIAYYQKSVQSNPNYLLAHENLLALYRYLERKEEAEKEEEALRSIHLRLGFPLGFPLDKP